MKISVAVPTYNRSFLLEKCLRSLCNQSLPQQDYEIIVVNNNCTDNTEAVVHDCIRTNPHANIRLLNENRQGLSHARNKALSTCRSPFIVYIDDDATAELFWLEKFLNTFSKLDQSVAKVSGQIVPEWGAERPSWLTDEMLFLYSAKTCDELSEKFIEGVLPEANSCYRTLYLQMIGGFPTTLGRVADSLISGENSVDFIIGAAGYKLFFSPEIVMTHHIHKERLTPDWARNRWFWQGVTQPRIDKFLLSKNLQPAYQNEFDLPGGATWNFIADPNSDPTMDELKRIYNLGYVLSMRGYF